jgi:hypothetical protein
VHSTQNQAALGSCADALLSTLWRVLSLKEAVLALSPDTLLCRTVTWQCALRFRCALQAAGSPLGSDGRGRLSDLVAFEITAMLLMLHQGAPFSSAYYYCALAPLLLLFSAVFLLILCFTVLLQILCFEILLLILFFAVVLLFITRFV